MQVYIRVMKYFILQMAYFWRYLTKSGFLPVRDMKNKRLTTDEQENGSVMNNLQSRING